MKEWKLLTLCVKISCDLHFIDHEKKGFLKLLLANEDFFIPTLPLYSFGDEFQHGWLPNGMKNKQKMYNFFADTIEKQIRGGENRQKGTFICYEAWNW
jgi:hypothetical protein